MRGRSRALAAALASVAACACGIAFAAPAEAASFSVDDLDDAADETPNGICDATGADACTLRAAFDESSSGSGGDTITIVVAGRFDLTLGPLGLFSDNLETTTVNGHPSGTTLDNDAANASVLSAGGPGAVVLNDLTVTGGTTVDNQGAGIASSANSLTLNRVVVTGNTVNSASGGSGGAGILTFGGGALALNDSTVSANTITGLSGIGGGIRAGGPLTLTDSTISGNSTTLDAGGRGGGIDFAPGSSPLTLTNSTVSGNMSGNGGGGGIFATNTTVFTVTASTIAGNSTSGQGGGVHGFNGMSAENSIFALNTAASAADCAIPVISPENNIESGTSCNFGAFVGNQENVTPTQLALGALASNGGPTETRALGTGSVALNTASNDCGGLNADQRGISRPQGTACDVGAFEREFTPTQPPGGGTTTTPQPPVTTTPTPPKCKKGQKLKKGKCVKKKRKKK